MLRKFDLVVDGVPRKLEIKFKMFIRDGVITLDGKEIGKFKNKKELADGIDIQLDNNHVLRILFSNQIGTQQVGFVVSIDGEEVSGSAGDPDQIYEATSAIFGLISFVNILLSSLYYFKVIDFFVVNNAHASSMLVFGIVMGVSAKLVKDKNGIVLVIASSLFIAESIMSVTFWASQHATNVGGVYTSKFFLVVPMIKCIYHHYFENKKQVNSKVSYSTEDKINLNKELSQIQRELFFPGLTVFIPLSLLILGISYMSFSIPKNHLIEKYSITQYIHDGGGEWFLGWIIVLIFMAYPFIRIFPRFWLKEKFKDFSKKYYAVHGEISVKLADFFLGTVSLLAFVLVILVNIFSYTATHSNGVIYSSILTGKKDYKFNEVERVVLATKWKNLFGNEVNGAWMYIHFNDGEYQKLQLSNDKQKEKNKVKYIKEVLYKTELQVERVGYNPYLKD